MGQRIAAGWMLLALAACGTPTMPTPSPSPASPYARSVVGYFIPECSLTTNSRGFKNIFNDPNEVLGAPNGGGFGPVNWFGFLSLGQKGYVTVEMAATAVDDAGPDIRVHQIAGNEPVTLYVSSGNEQGPFVLVGTQNCGERIPGGTDNTKRYCDFDLALTTVRSARYFRLEDAENYPCDSAETYSEGTDIDAVELLHYR